MINIQIMTSIALARTIQAVDDGESERVNERLMLRAVDNIDTVTRKRTGLHLATAMRAARISTLQSKVLLMKSHPREKLYEKIGEYLFLEGKLLAAREAFLIALRHEGNQDLRLNILSKPATVIKAVLCRAIEHEHFSTGSCESGSDECPASDNVAIMTKTALNSIFWSDVLRSVIHEKLEWWLAKSKPMLNSYKSLQDGIYTAGTEAGVYLSRWNLKLIEFFS